MVLNNPSWMKELQHPLDFSIPEINTDLSKFVKDFPIEIIPHQTDDEYKMSTRHIKSNIKLASLGRKQSLEKL